MRKTIAMILATLAVVFALPVAADDFELAGVFTDHMVLQRDRPITVWGRAPAEETIEVVFDGTSATVAADNAGTWSVSFAEKSAGGPYQLTIRSASGATETVSDILVGDVFLCSGQSNMEMPVSRVRSAPAEIKRKHNPSIREFHVRYNVSPTTLAEFPTESEWIVAASDTVEKFSAACYFFARELQKSDPAALGLISSSWGGSQAEAWVGEEYLRSVGGMAESLDILNTYVHDPAAAEAALGTQWQAWWRNASGGAEPWRTAFETDTGWTPVPRMTSWKNYGDPALQKHDGMVWYRQVFTLNQRQASGPATLTLGKIEKGDVVWVNGHYVGRSFGWEPTRQYELDADIVKPGLNRVLVNVRSTWGDAGFTANAEAFAIALHDGDTISLSDAWEYKKEPIVDNFEPTIPWKTTFGLSGMFNAMIAPLQGLSIRGAIWYQGESNTRRAAQYSETLEALIGNWRNLFGDNLPFVIVQLPEFGLAATIPAPSDWSNLREAQRQTALRVARTGLVVTMGLGDPTDIHPTNKQDVGKRTAAVYRGLIGETAADTTGFSPRRVYRQRRQTVIEFDTAGDGLVTRSADHPIAFELCEGTPLVCVYAETELENNTVVLQSKKIRKPTHVRYCWGNSPTCNLYTAGNLPVGPFETAIE